MDNARTAQELADAAKELRRRFGSACIQACFTPSAESIKEMVEAESAIDEFMGRLASLASLKDPAALPRSDSEAARAAIEAVFAERNHPCAPTACARAGFEAAVRISATPPAPAQAEQSEDGRDAARYREIRERVRAHRNGFAQQFEMPSISPLPGVNIMRGSVAQHFDAAIDAAIAAKEQS